MSSEVSIGRRLLAFYLDQIVAFLGMIPVLILGAIVAVMIFQIEFGDPFEGIISPLLLAYCVVQFSYQYWSLLTGNPTVGQTVTKFYVDAGARNFQPGFTQMWLGNIGVNLVDSPSSFWPATLHIVLASLTLPLWPFVIIEALINSEHRFWWARISGTTTVDMKVAFRKIPR